MEMKKVSPRARKLWLMGNLIILFIITAAEAIALIIASDMPHFAPVAAVGTVSWGIMAVLLLVFPSLKYKNYLYSYDEKRFILRSGVIFRHEITAPICQIQDLHFYEGPVMRIFGLGKIMLSTGGSNFELVGLDAKEAQAIIEDMEEKLRERIEVQSREEI